MNNEQFENVKFKKKLIISYKNELDVLIQKHSEKVPDNTLIYGMLDKVIELVKNKNNCESFCVGGFLHCFLEKVLNEQLNK